jgi:nucleoredoxin
MKRNSLKRFALLATAVCCGWMMSAQAADPPSPIAGAFKGLVDAQGQPFASSAFDDAKIYVLYFGASWCPDCRAFSPSFVKFINENAAANPHLAAVMLNDDKTPAKMLAYMQTGKMPFPSIPRDTWKTNPALEAYAGKYIPQVVVIDSTGKVLASNFQNDVYAEPAKTLDDLKSILDTGAAK